jgi:hypothetical protein
VAGDLADKIATGFQTGGKAYLFSALQPPGPPGGSPTVVSLDRKWFHGIVLVVIIGVGLLLLPCSASRRWLAGGAAIVVVVAIGIFLPTLARQMANLVTVASAFVVLVIWLLKYILVTRPKASRQRKEEKAAAEAPAKPETPADQPAEEKAEEPTEEKPQKTTDEAEEPKSDEGGEDNA